MAVTKQNKTVLIIILALAVAGVIAYKVMDKNKIAVAPRPGTTATNNTTGIISGIGGLLSGLGGLFKKKETTAPPEDFTDQTVEDFDLGLEE